jgi:hypothetical protein
LHSWYVSSPTLLLKSEPLLLLPQVCYARRHNREAESFFHTTNTIVLYTHPVVIQATKTGQTLTQKTILLSEEEEEEEEEEERVKTIF